MWTVWAFGPAHDYQAPRPLANKALFGCRSQLEEWAPFCENLLGCRGTTSPARSFVKKPESCLRGGGEQRRRMSPALQRQ